VLAAHSLDAVVASRSAVRLVVIDISVAECWADLQIAVSECVDVACESLSGARGYVRQERSDAAACRQAGLEGTSFTITSL